MNLNQAKSSPGESKYYLILSILIAFYVVAIHISTEYSRSSGMNAAPYTIDIYTVLFNLL